jgi:hypothetical protein
MEGKTAITGPISGDRTKRCQLWRVRRNGELIEPPVAEADSLEQLNVIQRRADWLYEIRLDGRPLPR